MSIREVTIHRVNPDVSAPTLERFRQILATAEVIGQGLSMPTTGPVIPWCGGAFSTIQGLNYQFVLFRNGLGDLILPGGSHLMFRFDQTMINE